MGVKKGRNRDTRESHSSTARNQEEEEHKWRKSDFRAPTAASAPRRAALPVSPQLPPAARPSSTRNPSRLSALGFRISGCAR